MPIQDESGFLDLLSRFDTSFLITIAVIFGIGLAIQLVFGVKGERPEDTVASWLDDDGDDWHARPTFSMRHWSEVIGRGTSSPHGHSPPSAARDDADTQRFE